MKTLTLLRHAKSSWKQPDLSDFERPLNGRGREDAPEMGHRLARRGLQPTHIVSSPAVRARATAEAVADALGYPPSVLPGNHASTKPAPASCSRFCVSSRTTQVTYSSLATIPA
ncbi:SixA phosphatase family protein [Acidihalobacter yilgarnensis]|uniref:SixA phosphatase family protein n=1 Tax=Acidihalobacter yilgarnensis TaxID=2819280 RepID=UPI0018D2AEE2|nr:histidine phosphatase family protein [Acidihalobacter yilgarnensis]